MAKINLRTLEKSAVTDSLKGMKLYIYGGNDLGKTYQMSRMSDKTLLIATEAGYGAADCAVVDITKWTQFKDIVNQLTSEKVDKEDANGRLEWETMQDIYDTILIDTGDNLIDLAEKQTCVEFGVRDLSEIEDTKKNGYSIYRKDFKAMVDKLCHYGYVVIFIAHEEYVDKTDLKGNKYSYMQPKNSGNIKSSARFLRDLCDVCVALVPNGVDEEGNPIPSTAICKETKTIFARSRYAMPTYIQEFTAENLRTALLEAKRKTAEMRGANMMPWQMKNEQYTVADWVDMIKPYFKAIKTKFPEKIEDIVEGQLGPGGKISKATEGDLTQLENIYNQMVTFANDQNIAVE